MSSAISMPIDDPPNRGFTMYGPAKLGSTSVDTASRGRLGMPAACMRPPNASLSMPTAPANRVDPVAGMPSSENTAAAPPPSPTPPCRHSRAASISMRSAPKALRR